MAEVTVRVNGYVYTVGCEDGQEAHLQSMAGEVDARIASIKAVGAQSGESRLLLLAALLLADELSDMKLARPQAARAPAQGQPPPAIDPELARRLGRLALRAEAIADAMERP
ncbi:MAG TPA: cell division protein ZapA [Acetobacteraceae bacterium]|nr:cell division protein ZapA [Acetobacteraceae bacterium]